MPLKTDRNGSIQFKSLRKSRNYVIEFAEFAGIKLCCRVNENSSKIAILNCLTTYHTFRLLLSPKQMSENSWWSSPWWTMAKLRTGKIFSLNTLALPSRIYALRKHLIERLLQMWTSLPKWIPPQCLSVRFNQKC